MEAEEGIEPSNDGFANHDFDRRHWIIKIIAQKLPENA
jgi:hypothetical protein